MLSSLQLRSSLHSRLIAIEEALLEAHRDAVTHSRSSLNRMPEFFMAMRVADYFAMHFPSFGYRLEAQVKRTFKDGDLCDSDIAQLCHDQELRSDGRFDLVLLAGKRGKPAHVLEFKHGDKLEAVLLDIRRLAKVCELAGNSRLKTNYLVLTKKCDPNGEVDNTIDRLVQALEPFDKVNHFIWCTDPLGDFLDRDHQVTGTFRVVIVELRAKQSA